MEVELKCNGCRKVVKNIGWVTTCSHLFCDEDGQAKLLGGCSNLGGTRKCPACDNELSDTEFARVDLKLTDHRRSLLLAAQRPDTILDICSRAMQFFVYQVHQELAFSSYCVTKLNETVRAVEQQYQTQLTHERSQAELLRTEMQASKQQVNAVLEEYHAEKLKNEELAERFAERSREYKRLLTAYDELKRKMIVLPSSFVAAPGEANANRPNGLMGRESFPNAATYDTSVTVHATSGGLQHYATSNANSSNFFAFAKNAQQFAAEDRRTPMHVSHTPKQTNSDTPARSRNVFVNMRQSAGLGPNRHAEFATFGDLTAMDHVQQQRIANVDHSRTMPSITNRGANVNANRSFLG